MQRRSRVEIFTLNRDLVQVKINLWAILTSSFFCWSLPGWWWNVKGRNRLALSWSRQFLLLFVNLGFRPGQLVIA